MRDCIKSSLFGIAVWFSFVVLSVLGYYYNPIANWGITVVSAICLAVAINDLIYFTKRK